MGDVITWRGITKLSLPPDRLLEEAKGKLDQVVIIGLLKDGSEYFSSSEADGGTVAWHLDRAKHKLMKMADDDD